MSPSSPVSRRTVLTAGAAGAGALAVAACSSGSGGGPTTPTRQPPGKPLAVLAQIPVGTAKPVELPDGSPAVVARPSTSTTACFSAICTHEGCTVAPHGRQLDCPCHGSRFDAMTGAVVNGPASRPLPRIDVRVEGGDVVTA